jgi:hypothetical protein
VGSIYPAARILGISDQDLGGSANEHMRRVLGGAMSNHPPLLFAAGHEHALEVFRGPFARFSVVSGSGIEHHQTSVQPGGAALHVSSRPGYMRLDVSRTGRVRLGVIELVGDQALETASFDLATP